MELVALLSSDASTWNQVLGLIKKGDWEKIIILSASKNARFSSENMETIYFNGDARLVDMKEDLKKKLKGKIRGTEVSLSIASGNGKEHMALISALLSLPAGIRFAAMTKEGVIEL